MATGEQKDGEYGNDNWDKMLIIHAGRMQKPKVGDKQFSRRVNAGLAASLSRRINYFVWEKSINTRGPLSVMI